MSYIVEGLCVINKANEKIFLHFYRPFTQHSKYNKSLNKETFARYRSMQYGVNREGTGPSPPIVAQNFC